MRTVVIVLVGAPARPGSEPQVAVLRSALAPSVGGGVPPAGGRAPSAGSGVSPVGGGVSPAGGRAGSAEFR